MATAPGPRSTPVIQVDQTNHGGGALGTLPGAVNAEPPVVRTPDSAGGIPPARRRHSMEQPQAEAGPNMAKRLLSEQRDRADSQPFVIGKQRGTTGAIVSAKRNISGSRPALLSVGTEVNRSDGGSIRRGSMILGKLRSKILEKDSAGQVQIFEKLKSGDELTAKLAKTVVNPLSLRFNDTDIEKKWAIHYFNISIKQVHVAAFVALLAIVLFAVTDELETWGDPFTKVRSQLLIVRLVLVTGIVLFFFVTYTKFFKKHMQILMVIMFLFAGVGFSIISLFKNSVGIAFIVIFFVFIYLVPRLRFIWATVIAIIAFAVFDVVYWLIFIEPGEVSILTFIIYNGLIILSTIMNMYTGYAMERYLRRDFLLKQTVEAEQGKTEGLLKNMLPRTVVNKLKEGRHLIADQFQEVTVLLSDIVGFTNLAAQMAPQDLVPLMNQVYSQFDELSDTHGVYKLETIGDAYMAVGGLPEPRPDHADAIAEMALDMQKAMEGFRRPNGDPLQIRIGIHSGQVIAGVVGAKKMPRYWVWGETVEIAMKMEHSGVPGRIHLSDSTERLLRNKYQLENRYNDPEAKQKGNPLAETYLLSDRF